MRTGAGTCPGWRQHLSPKWRRSGKPIALEALDFGQRLERGKGAKTLSRLASQFNHGQVISAIERRASKKETGTVKVKVKPAFTSVIGSVKDQKQLGLSVHESAALTIGRRALGYRERVRRSSLARMMDLLFHLRSGVAQSPKAEEHGGRSSGRRRAFWVDSQFVPSGSTTVLAADGRTDGARAFGGT